MIDVTRMNGSLLTINNHLIEMVEDCWMFDVYADDVRQHWRTYKLLKVIPFDNQSTGIQRGGDDT